MVICGGDGRVAREMEFTNGEVLLGVCELQGRRVARMRTMYASIHREARERPA